MDTRIALIGIIMEKEASLEQLNRLLHEYGEYIVGRMGIPYHKKNINIIIEAIEGTKHIINALSGKIGMLNGKSTNTISPNVTM